jgi:hypothetical protein
MSLIATATPWTNSSETPSKRVSTLRKTIKRTAGIPDAAPEYETAAVHSLQSSSYNAPSDLITTLNASEPKEEKSTFGVYSPDNNRSEKVLELISNLSTDNDGAKLANFQPPAGSNSSKKPLPVQPSAQASAPADTPFAPLPNEFQLKPPAAQFQKSTGQETRFYPNPSASDFSNYRQVYTPSMNQGQHRYLAAAAAHSSSAGNGSEVSSKLMDKINYMIHMLEQQQNERTDNVMEEFILYTLLGVFIIFVVDAFARSGNGRYVR